MGNRDETEPFLNRWSRRKRGQTSAKDDTAAAREPRATVDGATPIEPGAGSTEEAPLDLSKLPRVEDLTADTDITAFLDRRVPAALRNAALNRMWTLDPTIRDFIEVAELQWNWNIPGGAPFYEVIEPGSATSALVGDASSAIVRALRGDSPTPEPRGTASPGTDMAATTQKIDPSSATDAAAQQYGSAKDHDTRGGESGTPARNPVEQTSADATAALQQHTDPAPLPARRHGGALPV